MKNMSMYCGGSGETLNSEKRSPSLQYLIIISDNTTHLHVLMICVQMIGNSGQVKKYNMCGWEMVVK